MMKPFSIRFLAAALMALAFVCGFLSGRLTAPRGDASPVVVADEPSPPDASVATSRRVMRRYAEDLGLSREQVRELRAMFEAAGRRMVPLEKNSEARLKELERFHAELEPHLTPEQREKARAMLENSLRRKRGEE
jgi:glutathione S-transferase